MVTVDWIFSHTVRNTTMDNMMVVWATHNAVKIQLHSRFDARALFVPDCYMYSELIVHKLEKQIKPTKKNLNKNKRN